MEAIQRIVPRRHLILHEDDVLIERQYASGFIGRDTSHLVYELRANGARLLPGRFVTFDRAAIEGEDLARTRKVCLFYRDAPGDPLFLLGDFR